MSDQTPRVPDEPRATVASAIYEAWHMIEAHANPQSASPVLADAAIGALKAAGWRPAAAPAEPRRWVHGAENNPPRITPREAAETGVGLRSVATGRVWRWKNGGWQLEGKRAAQETSGDAKWGFWALVEHRGPLVEVPAAAPTEPREVLPALQNGPRTLFGHPVPDHMQFDLNDKRIRGKCGKCGANFLDEATHPFRSDHVAGFLREHSRGSVVEHREFTGQSDGTPPTNPRGPDDEPCPTCDWYVSGCDWCCGPEGKSTGSVEPRSKSDGGTVAAPRTLLGWTVPDHVAIAANTGTDLAFVVCGHPEHGTWGAHILADPDNRAPAEQFLRTHAHVGFPKPKEGEAS